MDEHDWNLLGSYGWTCMSRAVWANFSGSSIAANPIFSGRSRERPKSYWRSEIGVRWQSVTCNTDGLRGKWVNKFDLALASA